ncbi:MAG TPA: HAMP domain-containing sensor histidine kinase, partial [Terriglobales bacterium]|nr:HAMP domain-containing sensor histidine kinase [Terriglobales bacterium]
MASAHKNACVSEPGITSAAASRAVPTSNEDVPAPENLLQEYKDLRERFQRTTNALASAAHDLKTPLSILNGYVELLHSEKLGPLSERQREVLQDMRDSGKRLQSFIQDFLTYSALEIGGLRMHFETADLNECLSGVCRLWSSRFQQKGIALYFLANEKLPIFPFDAPKLERVISNLLENSF